MSDRVTRMGGSESRFDFFVIKFTLIVKRNWCLIYTPAEIIYNFLSVDLSSDACSYKRNKKISICVRGFNESDTFRPGLPSVTQYPNVFFKNANRKYQFTTYIHTHRNRRNDNYIFYNIYT